MGVSGRVASATTNDDWMRSMLVARSTATRGARAAGGAIASRTSPATAALSAATRPSRRTSCGAASRAGDAPSETAVTSDWTPTNARSSPSGRRRGEIVRWFQKARPSLR